MNEKLLSIPIYIIAVFLISATFHSPLLGFNYDIYKSSSPVYSALELSDQYVEETYNQVVKLASHDIQNGGDNFKQYMQLAQALESTVVKKNFI